MPDTKTPAKRTTSGKRGGADKVWTDDEVAAMQEHAREMRTASRRRGSRDERADGEADLRAKLDELQGSDRAMGERIHELVTTTAPELMPRTWYGMPAYALDGRVTFFYQAASKFKARYATFGFNEDPRTDEGAMWPTSWALTELTPEGEATIVALVKKVVGR
jgi:uncharacterized protein YdhG (YjbR/CyaY superfamily)